MIKLMKKFLTVAVAAVLLVLTGICAAAAKKYPEPTDRFFINDYAGVIDSSAEDEIYSRAAALYEKTGAQAVVAAVKNLGGEEPAEYALGLGRQWGVGDKKKNNGVVILFALEERQIYIAVGYGLEGALPDINFCIASFGKNNTTENEYIVVTLKNSSRWPAIHGQINLYRQFVV